MKTYGNETALLTTVVISTIYGPPVMALRKKECPFEKRVPFVATVTQGHRFGTLISLSDVYHVYYGNNIFHSTCLHDLKWKNPKKHTSDLPLTFFRTTATM